MLTTYFTRERTRATYAAGPAGPYLDDFSHWLEQRGFTTRTIRRCLFGQRSLPRGPRPLASRYNAWRPQALRRSAVILPSTTNCGMRQGIHPRRMGAHHFLTFLMAQGMTAAPAARRRVPPSPLLNAFQHWMDVHRGVTERTLRNYRPIILDLLTTCGERPEQLEAKSLRAFILHRAHSHGKGKAKNVVTATRMFVRFLIASGRCAVWMTPSRRLPCGV